MKWRGLWYYVLRIGEVIILTPLIWILAGSKALEDIRKEQKGE